MSAVFGVVTALVAPVLLPAPGHGGTASAAPPGNGQVVAFVASGVGNGHGRGLSQWGAYGRAVDGGQSWTQILDAYYGGTVASPIQRRRACVSVRLTGFDDATTIGIVDGSGNVFVNGQATGYPAVLASSPDRRRTRSRSRVPRPRSARMPRMVGSW